MYTLRPYQAQAVQSGIDFLLNEKQKQNSVIVIPSAGGKSLVIAAIVKKLKDKVLVFQPSKELLEQNYGKFTEFGGAASIYSASKNSKEIGAVTFATIGSVKSKAYLFKDVKHILIDECHLVNPKEVSMYSKFFEDLNIKLLGLTATPIRLKAYNFPEPHSKLCMLNRQRPKTFRNYIHITQIKELYDLGFLAKCKYVDVNFNQKHLRVNSTGADFQERSLAAEFKNQSISGKIKYVYDKAAKRKHVLIFVSSLMEANAMLSLLDSCEMIHGKTKKKDREALIKRFKSGETRCVVNVGVLTVGFDYPEIDMILLARPTLSLALYYQMIGRGLRQSPGKTDCLIVDFVGNRNRFGNIEDLEIKEVGRFWGIYSKGKCLTNVPISN